MQEGIHDKKRVVSGSKFKGERERGKNGGGGGGGARKKMKSEVKEGWREGEIHECIEDG